MNNLFFVTAHAQETDLGKGVVNGFYKIMTLVVNPLISLLFTLALLLFLYGLTVFLGNASNQGSEAFKKGKRHMIWGGIGMFIMASVFGIIRLLEGTVDSLG